MRAYRVTGDIRSIFGPFMNTAMSTANTQRAQRGNPSAQQHQQATPCVCGTSICAVLLWLVAFFVACFVSVVLLPLLWAAHKLMIGNIRIRTVDAKVLNPDSPDIFVQNGDNV